MARKDILGQDVVKGDFIVYTSPSVGLRVGLVVDENADGWTGSTYTYVQKKVKTVTLDYRDNTRTMQATATPVLNMMIKNNDIPQEHKDILLARAKELEYDV